MTKAVRKNRNFQYIRTLSNSVIVDKYSVVDGGEMSFVHLHCHTDYSFGDSTARIEDYIEAAQEAGMKALAISDTDSIAGAIRFSELCKKANIKPIIASELSFQNGSIICIAMNEEGMNNLAMLVSLSHNKLTFKDIERHNEGLICFCGSAITNKLTSGKTEEAESIVLWLRSLFEDRFYIELQDHGKTEEKEVLPILKRLADDFGIGCLCTNDVHYLRKDDADAYDTLCCIRDGKQKDVPVPEGEYYFKNESEMETLFSWCPGALKNTLKIADQCTLDFIEYARNRLSFPCPELHQNPDEYIAVLAEKGLKKRYAVVDEKAQTRLRDELRAIRETDCAGLFLVLRDIVSWARSEGIAMSAGRYPYVCSLVCYLIDITDIDPLEHGLIFERFINSEYPKGRIYIPLLTSSDGRTRIIDYIKSEYEEYDLAYAGCTYTEHDIYSAVSAITSAYGCPEFPSHIWNSSIEEFETCLRIWNFFSDKPIKYADSFIESVRRISNLKNGYSVQEDRIDTLFPPKDRKTPVWSSQKNSLPLIRKPDYDLPIVDYDFYSPVPYFQITTSYYLQYIDEAEKIIRKGYAPSFDIRKINMADAKVFKFLIPQEPYEKSYEFLSPVEEITYDFVTFKAPWHGKPYFWEILEKIKPQSISELAASIALAHPHANVDIDEYLMKEDVSDPVISRILSETNGHEIYEEQFILEISDSEICTIAETENALRIIRKNNRSRIYALEKEYVRNEIEKGIGRGSREKILHFRVHIKGCCVAVKSSMHIICN